MPGITALTILLTIYATGEMIAKKTKAVFSTVLGIAMLLLAGFWTGILPETIFSDCGADKFGNVIAGILITSLGTTIDFEELKRQWKVVLVSLMGVLGAVAGFIAAGCLFGMREMAIAGAPVFAGGSAATLIMTTALKDRSMELASTFCIVLYVMQKFIGVPVASHFLRIEARNFRKITENIQLYRNKTKEEEKVLELQSGKKLLNLPRSFTRPSVFLAKLAASAMISHYLAEMTGGAVHYFVMCLMIGILLFSLGFLDKFILQKTQANGVITFLVTIIIFSNLASTTPAQMLEVLEPLVILSLSGVSGVVAAGMAGARIFRMGTGLAISLGISCTFGFPTTMLMPQEVAQAIGETEEEKAAIENYLLPKMLTAGLVTVTIVSVLIAGVAVNSL